MPVRRILGQTDLDHVLMRSAFYCDVTAGYVGRGSSSKSSSFLHASTNKGCANINLFQLERRIHQIANESKGPLSGQTFEFDMLHGLHMPA